MRKIREILANRGVKFIVSIFDDAFSEDIHYSKGMILIFYKYFLEWICEDKRIGLIIKPKRPGIQNKLQEIKSLFNKACYTGRCVVLDDPAGRLPSDAAYSSDIAVGIGISSAVSEVIVAGCKGIYCDLTNYHKHPFYQFGYGRIIFNNIEELIETLKRYAEGDFCTKEIGDFSNWRNLIDPFCDGLSHRRIGGYFHSLLKVLDGGGTREEAIRYSNTLYAERWGNDKIINMNSYSHCRNKSRLKSVMIN